MTQDKAHPTPPAVPSAIADFICRGVAEIPDRNSPKDWPEAMLVTHAELRMIVDEALAVSNWGAAPVASNTTAEPAPIQPAGVEVEAMIGSQVWFDRKDVIRLIDLALAGGAAK